MFAPEIHKLHPDLGHVWLAKFWGGVCWPFEEIGAKLRSHRTVAFGWFGDVPLCWFRMFWGDLPGWGLVSWCWRWRYWQGQGRDQVHRFGSGAWAFGPSARTTLQRVLWSWKALALRHYDIKQHLNHCKSSASSDIPVLQSQHVLIVNGKKAAHIYVPTFVVMSFGQGRCLTSTRKNDHPRHRPRHFSLTLAVFSQRIAVHLLIVQPL